MEGLRKLKATAQEIRTPWLVGGYIMRNSEEVSDRGNTVPVDKLGRYGGSVSILEVILIV